MNITLKHAWISISKYSQSDAVMNVDGVGETKVAAELPSSLLAQIEDFYRTILVDRLKIADQAKEAT